MQSRLIHLHTSILLVFVFCLFGQPANDTQQGKNMKEKNTHKINQLNFGTAITH